MANLVQAKSHARFLSFEGLDGSGKSTLMRGLTDVLSLRKVDFVVTREPGGTPLAEKIRQLILARTDESPVAGCELLLYAASRAQHVAHVIQPNLANGKWVLCDRFSESTVAFQAFARGLPRADIESLNRFAEQGTRPELVVLVDLPVELSRDRQHKRQSMTGDASSGPDRIEAEADEFHERVRQGYLAQVKEQPERWIVLDGRKPPEVLKADLITELERRQWI